MGGEGDVPRAQAVRQVDTPQAKPRAANGRDPGFRLALADLARILLIRVRARLDRGPLVRQQRADLVEVAFSAVRQASPGEITDMPGGESNARPASTLARSRNPRCASAHRTKGAHGMQTA